MVDQLTQAHRRPDAYHTCYNLAGLSMAIYQHQCAGSTEDRFSDPHSWATQHSEHFRSFAEGEDSALEGVQALQPVYVIPQAAVIKMQQWAGSCANLAEVIEISTA